LKSELVFPIFLTYYGGMFRKRNLLKSTNKPAAAEKSEIRIKEESKNLASFRGNILVTGVSRGAGSSTVGVALAGVFALAGRNVCFTEISEPAGEVSLIYDRYDINRRIGGRVFDYYKAASSGLRLRRPANIQAVGEGTIDWRIIKPEDVESKISLSEEEMARLIGAASGEINIFDVKSDPAFDRFLVDADLLICVVNPLPSHLSLNKARLDKLRSIGRSNELGESHSASNPPMYFLFNKMNRGISTRYLKHFIRYPLALNVPLIPPDLIYGAEYRCELPWESDIIFDNFAEFFKLLSDRIILF
jgi:hypothetical protein